MGEFPLCTQIAEVSSVVDKNEHSERVKLSLLLTFVYINS